MSTNDEDPGRAHDDPSQDPTAELTGSRLATPTPPSGRCDEVTVRLTIASMEMAALESHRGSGISDHELRATIQAAESARQSLAAGVDHCQILPNMIRQLLRSEVDDDEG